MSFNLPTIKRGVEICLIALIVRFPIVTVLKELIKRARPDPSFDGYSMPSGHAAFFFALATGVYLYNKKMGVVFYLVALVVAIMRVIEGAHYFSDVFVGAALGILLTYFATRLLHKRASIN
jgi:undecaprenyl-diphosphatase